MRASSPSFLAVDRDPGGRGEYAMGRRMGASVVVEIVFLAAGKPALRIAILSRFAHATSRNQLQVSTLTFSHIVPPTLDTYLRQCTYSSVLQRVASKKPIPGINTR